ncbi:MAG: hypothetical protein QOE49_2612 [Rhodospirillaceae bacterium]|nr:hypothetical protein [Rhodospirillaceae bacterium]
MRAPVGSIILLVLAAVLYAAMMSCLVDAPNSDAFGRGLALAYGAILGTALWIVLAVLLIIAAVKGRMPVWAILGLVVLVPLSCIVMWFAGDAYARGDSSAIWVAALLPPLFALYALWARLPALHTIFRAVPTSAVLGAAIAYLSVAPLVAMTRAALPDPVRDARLEEAGKAQEEQRAQEGQAARDREEAQFASLDPDSPLANYLIYLSSMAYGERALAGIRQVRNRQADAVLLLLQGRLADLRGLWGFDVAPTAALCQAYAAALAGAAGKVTKARTDYLMTATDLELQLPNMKWLAANRCDLGQPIGILEANVRAVADSDRMTQFADKLAALRPTRP